jgi:ATP-binding cassette subfamily B protein
MAKRTLSDLQRQYAGVAKDAKGGMRPPGPPRRGPGAVGMGGKPKNTSHTVRRLLVYIKPYIGHLIGVSICMLLSTVTALIGSYMLLPIINRVAGQDMSEVSAVGRWLDGFIDSVKDNIAPLKPR